MENEKVLTDHEIQYIVNSLPDGEWTAKERMMRDIGVGMGLKIARDKGYISPPTLNIGKGEPVAWMRPKISPLVPESVCTAWSKGNGTGWKDHTIPLYTNAHTKTVTVDNTGRPATLVVHDEKHEPVFTESEVKAMLHDMRSWIDPDDGEEGNAWAVRAKLHGIILDPAK